MLQNAEGGEVRNRNPFIFKARKSIAWVQDKQDINFRLEPLQSCFLSSVLSGLSGLSQSEWHSVKEEEPFPTASVSPLLLGAHPISSKSSLNPQGFQYWEVRKN